MKLIHLADLHLGKRLNEFSLMEDQEYILNQIIHVISKEKPDAVMISGDIYDKSVPSAEAVELFDDFLYKLSEQKSLVFVISGNHDSPERIAFGARFMNKSGIYMSPVYEGYINPVSVEDQYGYVNFYMLPFLKPANVRRYYPDTEINSYTDAVRTVIGQLSIKTGERNVLLTHQFVTETQDPDSESISVGGSENVSADVFADFDYIALGHIHGAQNIGSQRIRYSGAPLKYSLSEAHHPKSLTVVELREKGKLTVQPVFLTPLRDIAELRGTYEQVTRRGFYENTSYQKDYVHITLTDEEDIPDAAAKLRIIYPNLMKLDYDNTRTRSQGQISSVKAVESKTPVELFEEFFTLQNNRAMSAEQHDIADKMIREIWGE